MAVYGDTIQFAKLDIENDPRDQGHKLAHYDIVTATNVLHATKDIRTTLRNVRSLLRPDGKLIITEFINASGLLPGFTVGFFPGWWAAQEPERSMGPLLSEAQWNTVLLEAGFSGIDISFPGYRDKIHTTSTMISSVREMAIPKTLNGIDSEPITWIIIAPKSTTQTELALQLQSQLDSTCRIEPIDNLPQISEMKQCIFLPSLEEDVLQLATTNSFSTLISLISQARNFVWVYSSRLITDLGPVNEAIVGFARSIMMEQPDNKIKLLGLDRCVDELYDSIRDIKETILRVAIQASSTAYNDHQLSYIEKDGLLHINRLQTLSKLDNFIFDRINPRFPQPVQLGSQCLRINIATLGSLESLQLINDSVLDEPLADDELRVSVKACGIDFRDLLLALGKIQGFRFGYECAGTVVAAGAKSSFMVGDRVSCFGEGCMATHVCCKSVNAIPIPSWMTFTQGASWVISFGTAYYALVVKAQISKAERVLIHSGAGALGQACIQIAKLYGSEIFTTVGNRDKAKFLTDKYDIPDDHIFDSRSSKFEHDIMAATGDRGVDIIVNSLSGELLQASWRCIGSFGRFIETGKHDIAVGNSLPLSVSGKNVTFSVVDISQLSVLKPMVLNGILTKVLDLFNIGVLSILNTTTYPLSKLEQGLRGLQTGNTTGKIIIEIAEDDTVMVSFFLWLLYTKWLTL